MKVELKSDDTVADDINSDYLQSIASDILAKLKLKKPNATLEVFLVSNEKIKQINKEYLDIDKPTDVLSFPQKSFPRTKEEVIGTIFIAPDVAKKEDVDLETLFTHGFLHILGFDHETKINDWQNAERTAGRKAL